MSDSWGRPHFAEGGGDALVFYAVFGVGLEEIAISGSRHRTRGLPEGVEAFSQDRKRDQRTCFDLLDGYLGTILEGELPALAPKVKRSTKCVLVKGTVADPPRLDFLRDTIGVVTALLDGGVALLDAQSFRWWDAGSWRSEVFEPDAPSPHSHVTILESEDEEPGRIWVHTRGLRKFGRPDLSIRGVTAGTREGVHELCNRFIELQALGGIIPDGQPIRMESSPGGLVCRHAGSLEDPEFNNVHVAIEGLA